ncbi:MAG: stage 0 sporulation protein, partial [Clostridiales bacterium]|nr:stage 0 sporulation protein [Clostridiales bacterium]
MPKVIGVRFRTSPRMYYFAPTEGEEYKKGAKVVVETQRGVELATVILPVTEVTEDKIVAPLKPVARIATDSDIEAASADGAQKQEIIATAKQKVAARGLDMKIVDCEFTVDHSKLVLYFTAEQRVDFRELVRDLASAFHMRIDLRQIGAREECKLIGSLGACGMPCCCGRFESDSEHVSIKMAKCQNLALTPNKINGMCGRLLCCLSYENKTYEDVARRSPKVGSWVTCPDGRRGSVVSVTPLTEKVRLRVGDEDNFEFVEYTLSELKLDGNRGGNDNAGNDGVGADM